MDIPKHYAEYKIKHKVSIPYTKFADNEAAEELERRIRDDAGNIFWNISPRVIPAGNCTKCYRIGPLGHWCGHCKEYNYFELMGVRTNRGCVCTEP